MKKTFLLSLALDLGLMLIFVCRLLTAPLHAQSFTEFVGAPVLNTTTLYAEKSMVYDDSTRMVVITNPTTYMGRAAILLYTNVISDTLYCSTSNGWFKRNVLDASNTETTLGVTDANGVLYLESSFYKYLGIRIAWPTGKKATRCVVRMLLGQETLSTRPYGRP